MRLDETLIEIHAIQNLFRELIGEVCCARARFSLDGVAAVVTAAKSHPQSSRQPVVHKLEHRSVALVFFVVNSLARSHAQVNRLAQKQAPRDRRESIEMQIRIA